MYPLRIVLVGFQEEEPIEIRHELDNLGATVEAEFPSVKSAVASLPLPREEKRLFIFRLRSDKDARELERLNDAFIGRPILTVVNSSDEPTLIVQAMRAGAAQVVGLPIQVEDFTLALQRLARQFGHSAQASRVIAVSGVSEGCGATSLAINLSSEIARLGKLPCILTELSFRFGRLADYLGLEPRYTTQDLTADIERIDIDVVRQALVKVEENLHVLSGPYKAIATASVTPQHADRIVEYVRRLCQVVVLDMPYTFDDVYFRTIASADDIILVAQQTVPSIHALKTIQDQLQNTEVAGKLSLVINRYDAGSADFKIARIQDLLKVQHVFTVANDYKRFQSAMNIGCLLRKEGAGSPVLRDIEDLACALLGMQSTRTGWHVPAFLRHLVGPAQQPHAPRGPRI